MLQWLYDQVNWLTNQINWVVSFVNAFVSNPYQYISYLLDWVYNRAVSFVNAVKLEIANWTYSLYTSLVSTANWLYNLIATTVMTAVNYAVNWVNNLIGAFNYLVNVTLPSSINWLIGIINGVVSSLNWFGGQITSLANNLWVTLQSALGDVYYQLSVLTNLVLSFNFVDLVNKVGQLWLYIQSIDVVITKIIVDNLLRWLEDKIAEALE